jgi:protein TonB
MNRILERLASSHATGLIVVLLLHGAVLYGLWNIRVIPHMDEAVHVFVNLISPPSPPSAQSGQEASATPEPPKPARPSKPVEQAVLRPVEPTQHLLATEAPVESPTEATAPLPPPEPAVASPRSGASDLPASSGPSLPAGPVSLASELALVCPERRPPAYPSVSRRLGETGKVVLRVELDDTGRVSAARVITSSGFDRLDAAALAAVRTWRCRPAQRDGQAVRSVALQPFDFTLEGY